MMKRFFSLLLPLMAMLVLPNCDKQEHDSRGLKEPQPDSLTGTLISVSGTIGNHSYVDLGLPSGTKWAICNVGANFAWFYGDYFAWGEVEPKKFYNWSTYEWGVEDDRPANGIKLIRYCDNVNYGPLDFLYNLESNDDAAIVNWGNEWKMPTVDQQDELYDGCDWEWTDDFLGTGVAGVIGVSKENGNNIFLPAAGYCYNGNICDKSLVCAFWSRSLNFDYSYNAEFLLFNRSESERLAGRFFGYSVRPVVAESQK